MAVKLNAKNILMINNCNNEIKVEESFYAILSKIIIVVINRASFIKSMPEIEAFENLFIVHEAQMARKSFI